MMSCPNPNRAEHHFRVALAADVVNEERGGGVCWRSLKKQYISKYQTHRNYFRLYGKQRNQANSKLYLPFALQNAEEVLLAFEEDLYNADVELILDDATTSLSQAVKQLINLVVIIEYRQHCSIDFTLVSKNSLLHNQVLLAAGMMSADQTKEAEEFMTALSKAEYRPSICTSENCYSHKKFGKK